MTRKRLIVKQVSDIRQRKLTTYGNHSNKYPTEGNYLACWFEVHFNQLVGLINRNYTPQKRLTQYKGMDYNASI